jgi:hypothetical protein
VEKELTMQRHMLPFKSAENEVGRGCPGGCVCVEEGEGGGPV